MMRRALSLTTRAPCAGLFSRATTRAMPARFFSAEAAAAGAAAAPVQEVTVESLEALLDSERKALSAAKTRNEELSKQVETLKSSVTKAEMGVREVQSKARELQERVAAEIAEQDNIRERAAKDVSSAKKFGISGFCKQLLEVADTVDMAVAAGSKQLAQSPDNEPLKVMLDGVMMTQATFAKVLAKEGVTKYESLGAKVDPNLHFVTAQLPDPSKEAGTISFIIKEGYMISDRVLRPAQVCAVAKQ